METCGFRDSCLFFNEQTTVMPRTIEYLRKQYCEGGRFKECALHKIAETYGKDKVPKYLYPNDMFELLNFDLIEPYGGLDMFLKVIYPDGTPGTEKSSSIGFLGKSGNIVAIQSPKGWLELRRKNNNDYSGPEKRRTKPP